MDALERLVAAANEPVTDPERTRRIGADPAQYELYHFGLSLCSQKVRLTLIESGARFSAHDINVSMPLLGNYDLAYVRLRLQGREEQPLVRGYTGRSSTTTEGFDPAVVPTLVDLQARRVVTDSLRICRYVAARDSGAALTAAAPEALATELEAVDRTPHVALLYGAHPDVDVRPERLRHNMRGVHDRKLEKIRAAREQASGDPELVAAFDAKIAKEEAARGFVHDPEQMRAALTDTLEQVAALDARLADGRTWACGDAYSLADVFWAVSLFRLAWLGMGFAWDGGHVLNGTRRPCVSAYAERLFVRPAFRTAILDWPKTPRSEHVARYY